MKKFISILLCMTLLISGMCAINVYADDPVTDTELYGRAVAALKGVGVLDKDFDLNGEGYVIYREYISYLSKLIANSEQVVCRMINISSDSLDEVVTYDKAIEIMVKLLGWEYKAQQKGFLAVGASLGLDDGVKNIENFARYDLIMVLYNSLTADFLEQTTFGDKADYTSKDRTILGVYRDIKEFSGTLVANKWSTVYSKEGLDEDAVTIKFDDGYAETYNYYGIESMDLLGAYVSGYYKKSESGKRNEIVSLWNDDKVIVIGADASPSYEKETRKIKYTGENGKDTELTLSSDATIVVNGRNYENPLIINDTSMGNIGNIYVYKVKGKYKAVHIELYTSGICENAGKINSRIALKNAGTIELDYSEYDNTIYFFDANKNRIPYNNISAGNVVSVFRSVDNGSAKPLVYIYADNNKCTAKLLSERTDGFDTKYEFAKVTYDEDGNEVIDSETYEMSISFGCDVRLEVGNIYDLYSDLYGKIVYADMSHSQNGRLTGLYIKIAPQNATFAKSDYQIMMMPDLDAKVQENGKILKLSKNAKVDYEEDGIRKQDNIKNVDLQKLNKLLMHTAMYYYTNAEGEITKIVGYSTTGEKGYLFNFNPEGEKLYTHTIASVSGIYRVECSKHYWSSATYYGGDESATTSMDASDPKTFYGKKYIKYLNVSNEMIVLPNVSSPDEISSQMFDDYYMKAPVVKYGMVSKSDYLVYNAFSHDGAILPDYGTLVYDSKEMTKTSKYYHFYGSFAKYLINKVSIVSSDNGGKAYKFKGVLNSTNSVTMYSESDKIIDVAKSTPEQTAYFDEISEGDFMFVQCNARGEITMALKMCDYDPENDIVSIPSCPNLKRVFYDETKKEMVNDIVTDGIMDIVALSSQRVLFVLYPYESGDGGYSFVADKNALLNSPDPINDPGNGQYQYLFGGGTSFIYHTRQKSYSSARAATSSLSDCVTYTRDPSDISRVFLYSNLGEVACSVIYR